jgi:hypothetical protein
MKTLDQILSGTGETTADGGDAAAPEAAGGTFEAGGADAPVGPANGPGPDGDIPAPAAPDPAEPDPAGDDPVGPDPGSPMVPVGALIDERRKRRAAEERLARRGRDGGAGGARFRDDPEGYLSAMRTQMAAEIATVRVDAAENAARGRYRDYDVKVRAFARAAAADPALVAAMRQAPDPAEFAYRLGARVLGASAAAATPQAAAAPPARPRPPLPASLAGSPSAEGPPAAGWRPKPLSEIVGGR